MDDKFIPLGFILVGETPEFPDKKSKVIYYLEALLFAGIFTKMGNVLALGIYDLTHQLRVTPTLFHEFDFWDDDAFVMIEDIIANSPISNVDAIYFQYDDVACVVVPIRTGTYLIMLCKGNREILIHQFEKWRKQILHFVQQLDDEET